MMMGENGKPAAREMGIAEQSSLEGKRCLVTGATSGIGFEIALALAQRGAAVVGVGRDPDRCDEAANRILETVKGAAVTFEVADLAKQPEIRSLVERLRAHGGTLDVLVNNAGLFSGTRTTTIDGIELQFAVNYLAGFLLVALLYDRLAKGARIILVSSASHRSGRIHWNNLDLRPVYNGLAAYGQSKLAGVLFSYELARRAGEKSRVSVYAADPGLVRTNIGLKGTGPLVRAFWSLRARGGDSPHDAAAPIAGLAHLGSVADQSGFYWKDGKAIPSSKRSYDRAAAARLWKLSEELCRVRFLEDPDE